MIKGQSRTGAHSFICGADDRYGGGGGGLSSLLVLQALPLGLLLLLLQEWHRSFASVQAAGYWW